MKEKISPHWKKELSEIQQTVRTRPPERTMEDGTASLGSRRAYFILNVPMIQKLDLLVVDFWARERGRKGDVGSIRPCEISKRDLSNFSDPNDRELLNLLLSKAPPKGDRVGRVMIREKNVETTLLKLTASGRLFVTSRGGQMPDNLSQPLLIDHVNPWKLSISVEKGTYRYRMIGKIERKGEVRDIHAPLCLLPPDFIVFHGRICKLENLDAYDWIKALRRKGGIDIPFQDGRLLAETLLSDPRAPKVDWPKELTGENLQPKFKLKLKEVSQIPGEKKELNLELEFTYSESQQKNLNFEQEIISKIEATGVKGPPIKEGTAYRYSLPAENFSKPLREMLSFGWEIEKEGLKVRPAKSLKMNLKSNSGWFDLSGDAEFAGSTAQIPELLEAFQKGETLVPLKDGTLGMISEEWVERYAPLITLGSQKGKAVRFHTSQALLLDSWLEQEENLKTDEHFKDLRSKFSSLQGLPPKNAPKGFKGKLRNYQEQGLAWLSFLNEFGIGGILADDMGLGKTIQLLAFLLDRKGELTKLKEHRPSMVIVPKTIVYNWIEEARKFTPKLKVVNYTGADRNDRLSEIKKSDLVITTYATLRLDIKDLKEIQFECVIADEAQAIKNPDAQASKALKLIKGRYKLAMTGTPIENSLKDLFSIMEFVNPVLLTRNLQKNFLGNGTDPKNLEALSRALRPIILRRTKEQVLRELPQKMEQTIFCELSDVERKLYNDLRDYYRVSLKQTIETSGMAKSRIQILTALLRLRQAACHPGLIDPAKVHRPSAKLATLIDQLHEVTREGHKVLVFSQFTSFLDIVRKRLQSDRIVFEYLDGKTPNREARVKRFQSDPKCRVFLISLKAGGVGLNLTGADYVYLLDPWWNPAVEAQAIDRAHRMGQRRKVFAYRLIASATVEEKIIAMQKNKREISEAIVMENSTFLKKMTSEDLQALLS